MGRTRASLLPQSSKVARRAADRARAAEAPLEPAPVLDTGHLHALSGGDSALGRELAAAFESECHAHLSRLSRAMIQVDWEAIEAVAARLSHACTTFGAFAMARLLQQIRDGFAHSHAPWREWGSQLQAEWERLRDELRTVQFG
ncbi:MAG: Hpt domain-containing protein [Dehalococcoidia bacterium]|nr:Hpt domain-containing protein [Dehalococcoidia bacterium]